MAEFSKFSVEMPEELARQYEKSPGHMTALLKGARARQQGLTRDACPYKFEKAPGFYFAWSKGWMGIDNGSIVIKDEP